MLKLENLFDLQFFGGRGASSGKKAPKSKASPIVEKLGVITSGFSKTVNNEAIKAILNAPNNTKLNGISIGFGSSGQQVTYRINKAASKAKLELIGEDGKRHGSWKLNRDNIKKRLANLNITMIIGIS